ncbi:MAG: TIGR03086 family metal-binding protein [Sporichthyaceae bacterium]
MIDGLEALRRADDGFDRVLRRIGAGDWRRPTPCAQWDVHQVVNHVVIGGGRYGRLVRGGSREDFLAERNLDALGDAPIAAWEENAGICRAAFAEAGALERIVPFPVGDMPGERLLTIRVVEVLVHTWDLARALRYEESADAEAARFALTAWREHGLPRAAGDVHFFDEPTLGATGSDLERLLRSAGREP